MVVVKVITHVAIRFHGKTYSLPKPNRHHNVIRHICETEKVAYVDAHDDDQGFLDDKGRYLTRKEAWSVAAEADQIRNDRPIYMYDLYSENLW